MRKLRVAIVAASLDIPGGQSVQADRLLRAWRGDPNVEAWLVPVHWALPRRIRWTGRIKGVPSAVMEMRYLPRLVPGLANADVVHVFAAAYLPFLLAPLPAMVVARALGRPVVLNYRNGEGPDHLTRSAIARAAMRAADRLVVPSQYLVDVLAGFGLQATAIPNIIDLERFRFRERDPLQPRVLSTRNLHELYNVACTLRAFRLVQDRHPEASLTVVGGGSQERELRALALDLRLKHVRFVGRVEPDAMADVYAEHDIYVQSPTVDNLPNSVIEAFACGLPVVSTDVGGLPRMITHEEHGLLAPTNDHCALAAHVLRLLDEPALAARLTRAARDTCHTYRWSTVRDGWLKLYDSAVTAGQVATAPATACDGQ